MKTNKQNKKHIAAGLSLALLVTGTFAWQSFSQEATNEILESVSQPGARLHDHFNGTNKDVFVENYGETEEVYARIRLEEYLEYGKDAGLGTASDLDIVRGDILNAADPVFGTPDTWDIYDYASTLVDGTPGDIRAYRELELGGQTKYMPTFNLHPYSDEVEVNGTFIGTAGDGRENKESRYDDYVDYTDAENATETATEYTPDPAFPMDPAYVVETQDQEHEVADTADATIMTMAEWMDAGAPLEDIWVFDTDGWAYYAKGIPAQSASGLLLDGIKQVQNPKEEWYYAVNVTSQFATAGDWGVGTASNGTDVATATGTGMYEGGMTEEGLYILNKAAGLVTVENMTFYKLGGSLEAIDTKLSTTSITFGVDMNVVNGLDLDSEFGLTWTITEENVASISTALDNTLSVDTVNNQATFTATQAMVDSGNRYIITATSTLDPSKSVKITMHDGSALEVPDVEEPDETPDDEFTSSGPSASGTITGTALSAINGATALDENSTVNIDGVEWYVLAKGTKTNEEGDEFTGALLYMKEPLKVDGEYTGFVFQDQAEDGYDASSWKMSDLRGTLAGKLADYPTLAAAAQSVDTTVNGYTSGTPETTYDKFFPLSEAEFTGYTLSGTDIAKDTAGVVGGYGRWLRSANNSTNVRLVNSSVGTLFSYYATATLVVRPALWVAL